MNGFKLASKFSLKQKRRLALGAGLLFAVGSYAYAQEAVNEIWGPFNCDACLLGTPMPDSITQVFIDTWRSEMRRPGYFRYVYDLQPGHTITICNGGACVTYTGTDSGNVMGGTATPITTYPPEPPSGGVGGGSGGSGGGGSGGGGSGGVGGGGGVVIVGPPTQEN
ncbi:hypothetical protein TR80_009575 [Xanthomonas campestris]|nr:hypothetical protein TR80_009575 [Xanthomonas campestris]